MQKKKSEKKELLKKSTPETGISEIEFNSRIEKIRKHISSKNLGALLIFSTSRAHIWYQTGHVSYLSGWADRDRIGDSIVIVPEKGDPVILISGIPLIAQRGKKDSLIKDVRIAGNFFENTQGFGNEIFKIIKEKGLEGKKLGITGFENMPLLLYQDLIDALSQSNIELTFDIVADMRSRKSSAEVALIRKAVELCDLGYEELLQKARPGIWGYEVIALMEYAVRTKGADYVQYWMRSGPLEDWSAMLPDFKPHRRKLKSGDQITCGSYVIYKGYWAHSMRTVNLLTSSKQQNNIFDKCLKIHQVTIDMIKPGVCISDVVKAVKSNTRKAGMKLHCTRIGHGIGLDYGEGPILNEGNENLFEKGQVVVVHIPFKLNLKGTDSFYVPVGDMCYVTEDGVEVLTGFPTEAFKYKIQKHKTPSLNAGTC